MYERVDNNIIKTTITKPAEEVEITYNIAELKSNKAYLQQQIDAATAKIAEIDAILAEDAKLEKMEEPNVEVK